MKFSPPARLFCLVLVGTLALICSSCETEDGPRGPSDDISALPWNRPLPGERTGPLGGMPMQSH